MHTPSWRLLGSAAALALLGAACGGPDVAGTSPGTTTSMPATTTAPGLHGSAGEPSRAAGTSPGTTTSMPATTIAPGLHGSAGEPSRAAGTSPGTTTSMPATTTAPGLHGSAGEPSRAAGTSPGTTTSMPATTTAPGHHGSAGEPSRFDADLAEATRTIRVQIAGGEPVGGHQRIEADLGSVVALIVTADSSEEVHVHGYDILRTVSQGHPAHFAFAAEIPGVFEVELERTGRLLLHLEIS